jgi:hypothetical protein
MLVEFGNICQTDKTAYNLSTTWTMVFSGDTPATGWAQSGIMLKYGYSCWLWWSQQHNGAELHDWYNGGCATQGTTHHVWQQLVSCPTYTYCVRSNVDYTVIHQSDFNLLNSWPQPRQVAYSGETYHDASDIPGYAAAPTDFSSMQIQSGYNFAFYDTCGNAYLGKTPPVARYSTSAPACDHVRTWTSG